MGHRDGCVCFDRGDVSKLFGAARGGPDSARGCLCRGLPAKARGAFGCADEVARQGGQRAVLGHSEIRKHNCGEMNQPAAKTTAAELAQRVKARFGELVSEPAEFRGEISLKVADVER